MTADGRVLDDGARAVADKIVAKYPNKRSAALPLLFLVQSIEGYVTERGMKEVGEILGLTSAEVLATSSFYTMLKKRPQGEYLISMCRNLSCTHNGAREVIEAIEDDLGIATGETTADGKFTLEAAECLATCDGAPSMQVNYEDFYRVTPESASRILGDLASGKEVKSVAGEVVKSAPEIARETAITGLFEPAADMEGARLVGGESPPMDMAPGHRPKVEGAGDG